MEKRDDATHRALSGNANNIHGVYRSVQARAHRFGHPPEPPAMPFCVHHEGREGFTAGRLDLVHATPVLRWRSGSGHD